jgi:hypothetical protein
MANCTICGGDIGLDVNAVSLCPNCVASNELPPHSVAPNGKWTPDAKNGILDVEALIRQFSAELEQVNACILAVQELQRVLSSGQRRRRRPPKWMKHEESSTAPRPRDRSAIEPPGLTGIVWPEQGHFFPPRESAAVIPDMRFKFAVRKFGLFAGVFGDLLQVIIR